MSMERTSEVGKCMEHKRPEKKEGTRLIPPNHKQNVILPITHAIV